MCSAKAFCCQGSWDSLQLTTLPPPIPSLLACKERCIIQQGYLPSPAYAARSARQAAVSMGSS